MARRKVIKRRRVLLLAIVLVSLVFGIGAIIHHVNKPPRYQVRYDYTVAQGETLWGIAAKHAPQDMDIREYIYELQKINGDNVAQLKAGQTITLYRY